MAGHKPDMESFGITLSFEARRLLTMNAHEQKQLEKKRKSLDKEKTAEETRLLRAQREALVHLYGEPILHATTRTNASFKYQPLQSRRSLERELFSSSEEGLSVDGKNSSKSGGKALKVGSDSSNISFASNRFLPDLDIHKIMSSGGGTPLQRSRSWSSQARPDLRFLKNRNCNDNVKRKHTENSTQQGLIQENSKDAPVERESERRERSLSEILPPAILPPLYSQKVKTLTEQSHPASKKKSTLSKEELWHNLEDCRYIRTHTKNNSR